MELFMQIVFGPKEDAIWPNNFCTCDDKCVTIIRCFHVNNSRSKEILLFDRIYCQYLIIALKVSITY